MGKGVWKRTITSLALALACAASLVAVASAQRRFPPQAGGGVDRRALAQAEGYSGDRFNYYTETWVNIKLFGGMRLTVAFVLVQAIWLTRHVAPEPAKSDANES